MSNAWRKPRGIYSTIEIAPVSRAEFRLGDEMTYLQSRRKVSKSGGVGGDKGKIISEANYGVLNSSKKRTKLTILSIIFTQDSEFCSFLEELRRPKIAFKIY